MASLADSMAGEPGAPESVDQRVQLTRGASYVLMQNLEASADAVVAFAVLARLISTKEMGILAILQLVSATCLTLCRNGCVTYVFSSRQS